MHMWEGAEGLTIAGDSYGEPRAPLVLLLHGGGQTRHAWRSTAKTLAAAGYYAVTIDARGHGDSDWSSQPHYDQDAFVQDLQRLVAALRLCNPA